MNRHTSPGLLCTRGLVTQWESCSVLVCCDTARENTDMIWSMHTDTPLSQPLTSAVSLSSLVTRWKGKDWIVCRLWFSLIIQSHISVLVWRDQKIKVKKILNQLFTPPICLQIQHIDENICSPLLSRGCLSDFFTAVAWLFIIMLPNIKQHASQIWNDSTVQYEKS